jgi:hypothetical protein
MVMSADPSAELPPPGQRRRLDARLRKIFEDAAQDRLMQQFRDDRWVVTDTPHNRPFDAEAIKDGKTRYLEAKAPKWRRVSDRHAQ